MFWATHSFCFTFAIKVSHYYKLPNLQDNYELKKKQEKGKVGKLEEEGSIGYVPCSSSNTLKPFKGIVDEILDHKSNP